MRSTPSESCTWMGKDVPIDKESAVRWFTLSAAQGNIYAQFFLDHMDQFKESSVLMAGYPASASHEPYFFG